MSSSEQRAELDRIAAAVSTIGAAFDERDAAIVAAPATGARLMDIAAAAGMTPNGVRRVRDRAEGGRSAARRLRDPRRQQGE